MIKVTPKGHQVFMDALTKSVDTLHLMTAEGELTEHGYAPKVIQPENWEGGEYPKVVWEFSAGDPVVVIGYFATDATGQVLFTEEFPPEDKPDGTVTQGQEIKNTGDRIGVTVRLSLISGGA